MEVTEQKNGKGAIGKIRHITISRRDTMVNDLKNSTIEGCFSAAAGVIALIVLALAVRFSYRAGGEAGYEVGILAFLAFLMAILAVLFGIRGTRNGNKLRHQMEKRGILLGALIMGAVIALFIRGVILYGR